MPIEDQIFSSPVDIPKLLLKDTPKYTEADCVDSLFTNFMYYAKKHWSYIASARAGGQDLLNGTTTQVPCGGIATALKLLIEQKLHQHVDYVTISGYVWTKPSFLCFDSKVKGNVSRAEAPNLWNEGCFFNEHYFIKCGAKYYDPCLNSIYTAEREAVRKHYGSGEVLSKGKVMAGENADSLLVFQDNVIVPGWQRGAWLIVKAANLFNYVTDKSDLLNISKNLKTGNIAMAARKQSRKLFAEANRLPFWVSEHRMAGIQVS